MCEEVRRQWIQALEDLRTPEALLEAGRYYASVFLAEQAAEKALIAPYIRIKRSLFLEPTTRYGSNPEYAVNGASTQLEACPRVCTARG